MEQLLGSFSLGLLLRSLFAGSFLVVSYAVATEGSGALSCLAGSDAIGKTMALALFAGVVAYTFHRSVVYPPLEWWLNSKPAGKLRENCALISDRTIEVLHLKWDQAAKDGSPERSRSEHLSSWADFAHLQYASAFCIAIGAWSGALIGDAETRVHWPLSLTALSLLIAALVSDWRLHAVREKLPSIKKADGTT